MRKALVILPLLVGCGAQEASTVAVSISTAPVAQASAMTDLGYSVTLTRARIAMSALEFTLQGEEHAANLLPHPGHGAGGEVTGELRVSTIMDFDSAPHLLGAATMLPGDYRGANIRFRNADASDGLAANDPLLGHTANFVITASKAGKSHTVDVVLDLDTAVPLIGAVLSTDISESNHPPLYWRLLATEPTQLRTLFDGVEFSALSPAINNEILIRPGSTEANVMRRLLGTHDFHEVVSKLGDSQ